MKPQNEYYDNGKFIVCWRESVLCTRWSVVGFPLAQNIMILIDSTALGNFHISTESILVFPFQKFILKCLQHTISDKTDNQCQRMRWALRLPSFPISFIYEPYSMKYLSCIAITSCRHPLKTITRGEWTPSVIVIKNLNYSVNFKNDI